MEICIVSVIVVILTTIALSLFCDWLEKKLKKRGGKHEK